jgi:hypothetical protein
MNDVLDRLAAMVVKQGIVLGTMSNDQRALALALVWRGLVADRPLSEREVNEALKAQLADAASFLDTDHVELRRWLVDARWLARDGYGREYRRMPARALAPASRALASALSLIEPARWCARQRATHAAERAARRRAWLAKQAVPHAPR